MKQLQSEMRSGWSTWVIAILFVALFAALGASNDRYGDSSGKFSFFRLNMKDNNLVADPAYFSPCQTGLLDQSLSNREWCWLPDGTDFTISK